MIDDLVSIITPLYNAEKYISDTIESVLNQTYEKWEMIIVDDCSSDKGVEIVEKYQKKDERIRLIRLEKNSGSAISRNKGIEEARGRYIAFLDSDDIWHREKLEKQISFMRQNNYVFTFTKYQFMSEDGKLMNKVINVPKKVDYKRALILNPIGCLTAIYDSKIIGKVYFPIIKKSEDYGFWLKILKMGYYGHGLNEVLAYYRIRRNSLSANKFSLVKYHWNLYRNIEKLPIIKSAFYSIGGGFLIVKLLELKEKLFSNEK